MSTRKNATISPDRAASDPDPITDAVPSSRSSRAKKRRQEEADTRDENGRTRHAAAKVARLASSAEEETKEQGGDETPDAPLTTEKIMNVLKDLWSDDKSVIQRALKEIGDIGNNDASPYENEVKMRGLGVQIVVFQVLQKHVGCLEIQEAGIDALANLCMLMQTQTLLGDIGCVEVILASMEKYPDSEYIQMIGCFVIGNLVDSIKATAERVEKSGGIAVVIAAMKKANTNSKELQKFGCYVLSRMSQWEEYRPLIVDAGGASAIALGVEKYKEDTDLRKEAYKTMQILFKE